MKTIEFKADNSAFLRTLRNCKKFCTVKGFDFYEIKQDDNTVCFYVHIKGTADICARLRWGMLFSDDGMVEYLNNIPDEQLNTFATVDGKLDGIRAAISAGTWTSNGDALFCELMGEFELAEQVRRNRAIIYKQREREERERRAQFEAEQQARIEAEQRKRLEMTEQAVQKLRDGQFITSEEFELLAEKYSVKLPIKFIGWLRKYCGRISITQHPEQAPLGLSWVNKYYTHYYYQPKHKSEAIFTYADKIAQAAGI